MMTMVKNIKMLEHIKSEPDSLSMSINHNDIGQTQLNTLYGILGAVSFKVVIKLQMLFSLYNLSAAYTFNNF